MDPLNSHVPSFAFGVMVELVFCAVHPSALVKLFLNSVPPSAQLPPLVRVCTSYPAESLASALQFSR